MRNKSYLKYWAKEVTFIFADHALQELWEKELIGQISDGMWENNPNSGWQFWCNIKTEVGEKTEITGTIPYGVKRNFGFNRLIKYTGDDMMEILKKTYPDSTEKDLKVCLKEISLAMKTA